MIIIIKEKKKLYIFYEHTEAVLIIELEDDGLLGSSI